MTTSLAHEQGLTLANLEAAIQQVSPFPERATYMEVNGKRYPVKDFSLQFKPELPKIYEDMEPTPIVSNILIRYMHGAFKCKLEPGWAGLAMGTAEPFTIKEMRTLRKHMRTKKDKETLKAIAQNPSLCQQDPRKLRHIARRKAAQMLPKVAKSKEKW